MRFQQLRNKAAAKVRRYLAAAKRRLSAFRSGRDTGPSAPVAALASPQNLKAELTTQLSFLNHDMLNEINALFASQTKAIVGLQQLLVETKSDLYARTDQIHGRLDELDNRVFESTNVILGSQSAIDNRIFESSNVSQHRFNELLNTSLPQVMEQVHEATALQLATTAAGTQSPSVQPVRPSPVGLKTMDDVLTCAKQDYPEVYEDWLERYETLKVVMSATKVGNAAHGGDTYSRLFKAFLERYARGAVLDVGCGPYGCPYYLKDYPADLVVGLDPLPYESYEDNVSLIRGISEYLPFEDGVFSTVVSGTSLDHCLSLERSLDEMTRVLSPDGVMLLWLGSIEGSPAFDPFSPDYAPADQYHLFHFDVAWFEPLLEQRFDILERIKLDKASFAHVFYALKRKPADNSEGSRAEGEVKTGTSV